METTIVDWGYNGLDPSHKTFMTSLRSAGLDAGTELKKELKVKSNEALGKTKPLGIIAGGNKSARRLDLSYKILGEEEHQTCFDAFAGAADGIYAQLNQAHPSYLENGA